MLTALKVAKAKADGKALRLGDGGGLYLLVRPTGSKAWVYRATVDGKRRDIGLGGFPAVGLAKARERAQEHREAVADGRNPIAERRRRAVPTFGDAVEAVFAANSHWSARHAETWRATLAKHAAPLWERPIDRIDRQDVLACLTPMWAEIAETGRRTRATLRQVMRWAIAHGYREDNPAGEAIEGALPRVRRHQVHHRALGYRDAPAAYEAIGTASAAALVPSLPDAHGEPVRRSAGRDVGGDRRRRARMAHTGGAHEGPPSASRAAIGRGYDRPGASAGVQRWLRARVSVASQDARAGDGTRRAQSAAGRRGRNHGPRPTRHFPRLGGRDDRGIVGGDGGQLGARDRQRDGAGLRKERPSGSTPGVDGRMGRVPDGLDDRDRRRWKGPPRAAPSICGPSYGLGRCIRRRAA